MSGTTWRPTHHRRCCFYLFSVAQRPALRPAADWLHCQLWGIFPSDLGAPASLALERFCQRQHGCDSPPTLRPPSSIHVIKGEVRAEQVLFMSCPLPASIQQLWNPRERVGRPPESDFLSAGEVAQHPDSSRGEKWVETQLHHVGQVEKLVREGVVITLLCETLVCNVVAWPPFFRMRQLLQWGGDALPYEALAPPLLLLHHRGQQWRIQEEEKGRQDMESNIIKNVHWSLNHK